MKKGYTRELTGLSSILLFIYAGMPLAAYAQTLTDTLIDLAWMVSRLVPLVIGLGVLLFLWGLVKYIFQTDSVEGKQSARNIMVWGVIAIFLMVALWGIIGLIQFTTGAGVGNPAWPQIAPFNA